MLGVPSNNLTIISGMHQNLPLDLKCSLKKIVMATEPWNS